MRRQILGIILSAGLVGSIAAAAAPFQDDRDRQEMKQDAKEARHETKEDQKYWHDYLKEQGKEDKEYSKASKKELKDYEKYLKKRRKQGGYAAPVPPPPQP